MFCAPEEGHRGGGDPFSYGVVIDSVDLKVRTLGGLYIATCVVVAACVVCRFHGLSGVDGVRGLAVCACVCVYTSECFIYNKTT